ncbi:hypothetical protein MKX03_001423 [Papaver bracteatum]|nr:hypothetical protein MKX03_001423 [Papaver bracteatum]
MSSSKRQKKTSSQATEDGQQTINARSVAAKLRWEKQMSDREKKRAARALQARADECIRLEKEYNDSVLQQQLAQKQAREDEWRIRMERKEQPENQFMAERKNNRFCSFNCPLDTQTSAICGGEINLGGEPQSREQSMHQQTQGDNVILDDKEYRQRVAKEKQRQTQVKTDFVNKVPFYLVSYYVIIICVCVYAKYIYLFFFQIFSEKHCRQYILGGSKARKKKAYNERKKAEREPKKKTVQKVKKTKQTRSAAQKARWAREKKADMERRAASSDEHSSKIGFQSQTTRACAARNIGEFKIIFYFFTSYASLTEEEKNSILSRHGKIKEKVVMEQQNGVSIGGNTSKQNKIVRLMWIIF